MRLVSQVSVAQPDGSQLVTEHSFRVFVKYYDGGFHGSGLVTLPDIVDPFASEWIGTYTLGPGGVDLGVDTYFHNFAMHQWALDVQLSTWDTSESWYIADGSIVLRCDGAVIGTYTGLKIGHGQAWGSPHQVSSAFFTEASDCDNAWLATTYPTLDANGVPTSDTIYSYDLSVLPPTWIETGNMGGAFKAPPYPNWNEWHMSSYPWLEGYYAPYSGIYSPLKSLIVVSPSSSPSPSPSLSPSLSPSRSPSQSPSVSASASASASEAPPEYRLIRRLRQSPHFSAEHAFQFHTWFQLDVEAGVGDVTSTDPQMMLQWSDDRGHTWTSELWVSAGRLGEFKRRAIWRRLGRSRDRIYRVVVSDPVRWVLIDAHLEVVQGRR
jgi:hypothetical protein